MIVLTVYIICLDKTTCKINSEGFAIDNTISVSKSIDSNAINVSEASFKTSNGKTISFDDQCKIVANKNFETHISDHLTYLLNTLFPIGYIYISTKGKPAWMNNFGTWEQIGTDRARFLVSVSGSIKAGKDGGHLLDNIGCISQSYGTMPNGNFGGRVLATSLGSEVKGKEGDGEMVPLWEESYDTMYPPYYGCYFYERTA